MLIVRARLFYNLALAVVPARVSQIIRYGSTGAVCACISNFIVISGSLTGIDYLNAVALSFVLVTPLGYFLQSRFTFGVDLSVRHFIRFVGSVAVGATLFLALIGLLHSVLDVPVWIASPLATLLIFCWNYAASCWVMSYVTEKDLRSIALSGFLVLYRSLSNTCGKRLGHD